MNVAAPLSASGQAATAHRGKRRLLYINAHLPRFDTAIGEHGRRLADALTAAGLSVTTFPAAQGGRRTGRLLWLKRLVQDRSPRRVALALIDLYLLVQGLRRSLAWSWLIWRVHRHDPPDLIVARAFEYDWSPWLAARLLGRPLALEIHAPFYIERQLRGRGGSTLVRALEHFTWRRADRVWTVSAALADHLAAYGIPRKRIRAISLGTVADAPRPTGAPDPGQPPEIVFMGSFFPWHGVEVLLRAFGEVSARRPEVRLRLIGDGVSRASCEALARSLGLERQVSFTGWLPYHEVARLLRGASIGVAPYLPVELFYFDPVKVLDYMAAGLAVVASDQGQIREMLDEGRCGVLVPPGDCAALSKVLLDLVDDPRHCRRLGAAAQDRVTAAYGWANTAAQLLDHCDDLFEEQGSV